MKFRIRFQGQDYDLTEGAFLIGRAGSCQISLDDPLVSRQHARLNARADDVQVEDLGSRNGVRVNGARITGVRRLVAGDRIGIGSQELEIVAATDPIPGTTISRGAPTHRLDRFGVIGALADKALAMGRGDEAARVLSALLSDVLEDVRAGRGADSADKAAVYAARLAVATRRGSWVNYVIDVYLAVRRPPPLEVIDDLYSALRKVDSIDLKRLRHLLDVLQSQTGTLGPADRFLVSRFAGLTKLAATR